MPSPQNSARVDWRAKILAHLHDPPEKAYDFSSWHLERARHYGRLLGLDPALWDGKDSDWTAAAADRFVFPDPGQVRGLGQGVSFRHPLSGEVLALPFPADKDAAAGVLDDGFPDFSAVEDDAERFFLLWRCWPSMAAAGNGGKALPYLPADTRIPDGTIWNHMSVVSAMEGARDENGKLAPAVLLFQIGPVQECIAQARSTRDLWSGSYLLSWLTCTALEALAADLGPDAVVFPNLRGQPLWDWKHREILKKAKHRTTTGTESKSFWEALDLERNQQPALTPSLPNRFLAIVPHDYDPAKLVDRIRGELKSIGDSALAFLEHKGCPLPGAMRAAWDYQLDQFLETAWQLWPWKDIDATMELVSKTPGHASEILDRTLAAARDIPNPDERCYPSASRPENAGLVWSGHFQLLSHRLDARRTNRNFAAWECHAPLRERDAFSGKEEALIDDEWLRKARGIPSLRHLFKSNEKLGAVNLLKRLWHTAYLAPKQELRGRGTAFDSVYAVAAAQWKKQLESKLAAEVDVWEALLTFAEAAHAASDEQEVSAGIATPPQRSQRGDEMGWIQKLDAQLLTESGWQSPSAGDKARKAAGALRALLQKAKLKEPAAYYAVIALDGDQVGKWLSGEHNPKVRELLEAKAVDYFAGFASGKRWLDSERPVSPSYHLGFSEALGNFGLYCARRVVEAHGGQLIYSGGDDVLAMVPAVNAIACTEDLRLAFHGDPKLAARLPDQFAEAPAPGLVILKDPTGPEPSWPIMVPGPRMEVSAGISIGHAKAPLQDMVRSAQEAEKRAKRSPEEGGLGRKAVALSLFKRSGEIIPWGVRFDSAGLQLLDLFSRLYRSRAIPGTFPNRVAELLGRFDSVRGESVTAELKPLIEQEIAWAWNQLEGGNKGTRKEAEEQFFHLLSAYLEELIDRGGKLRDVSSLFAIEAFLKRQAS